MRRETTIRRMYGRMVAGDPATCNEYDTGFYAGQLTTLAWVLNAWGAKWKDQQE